MLILYGVLYSKANSRRSIINRRTGKSAFIKSAKALQCVKDMQTQAKSQWKSKPLIGDVEMRATIFYPNRRHDLDESLLMDLLQGICYENDRQIVKKVITHRIDRVNPRVEVEIHTGANS